MAAVPTDPTPMTDERLKEFCDWRENIVEVCLSDGGNNAFVEKSVEVVGELLAEVRRLRGGVWVRTKERQPEINGELCWCDVPSDFMPRQMIWSEGQWFYGGVTIESGVVEFWRPVIVPAPPGEKSNC